MLQLDTQFNSSFRNCLVQAYKSWKHQGGSSLALSVTRTLTCGHFSIIRQKLNYTSIKSMSNSNPFLWTIKPRNYDLSRNYDWLVSWWTQKGERYQLKKLRSTESKVYFHFQTNRMCSFSMLKDGKEEHKLWGAEVIFQHVLHFQQPCTKHTL